MQTSKILLINTSPYVSGAEKSMKSFIDNNKNQEIYLIAGNKEFFEDTVDILHVNFTIFDFSWFKEIYKSIKYVKEKKPSVVYFNTEKSFVALLPLVLFCNVGKVIWHVRDNLKSNFRTKLLSHFSNTIICNSIFIQNQLKNINKTKIIYNGVNLESFLFHKLEDRYKEKIIACVSQITPWKKIEDFIEAAYLTSLSYSMVKFMIVGDVLNPKDHLYKKSLQDLINFYQLNNIIIMTGFIKDIASLFLKIDILCHTAVNEPFGRVIIEAMACGKPVVAYNSGGIKEIVTPNTGILVPSNDVKGITKALKELLDNEQKVLQMGKAGRKRVEAYFSERQYVKNMETVFNHA